MTVSELAAAPFVARNGWVDPYPHSDLGRPCTGPCCEPDAYPKPYLWSCQAPDCHARLQEPGECIDCSPPTRAAADERTMHGASSELAAPPISPRQAR